MSLTVGITTFGVMVHLGISKGIPLPQVIAAAAIATYGAAILTQHNIDTEYAAVTNVPNRVLGLEAWKYNAAATLIGRSAMRWTAAFLIGISLTMVHYFGSDMTHLAGWVGALNASIITHLATNPYFEANRITKMTSNKIMNFMVGMSMALAIFMKSHPHHFNYTGTVGGDMMLAMGALGNSTLLLVLSGVAYWSLQTKALNIIDSEKSLFCNFAQFLLPAPPAEDVETVPFDDTKAIK